MSARSRRPKPAAVDAVTGALLTTAYKTFEELRRIACANVANVHTVAYKRQVAQVRLPARRGRGAAGQRSGGGVPPLRARVEAARGPAGWARRVREKAPGR